MKTMRTVFSLFFCVVSGVMISSCGNHNKSTGGGGMLMSGETLNLTGSRQGHAVGFVDVDGDGMPDKVVGAPYAATTSNAAGAVLVYQGMETGFSPAPTAVFTGDDNLGYSFANVGNDFAVGAIHGDGDDVSLSGSVTIYRGGGNGQVIKKLSGEWPLDKFGFSIASGDLDNDGNMDLVVGAPFNTNDPALYQSGAVYVFFGPDFTTGVSLHASSANKGLGWAVAAGDVNGDGIDDLVLGASGKVLVFYGSGSFAPSINAPNIIYTSAASGFGKVLAVIGDIDGNAGSEIAIGAPNAVLTLAGVSSRDAGSVYIVNKSVASPINLDTATPDAAGPLITRLDGETLFSRFGASILPLGDVDGNGKPDFAVGAPLMDRDWDILSGMVYFFKGEDVAAGTPWAQTSAFTGMVNDQSYGASLAGVMLSSGIHALLIGAPRSDANTGGTAMVDPATGQSVAGGSSGGASGGSGSCH